MSYSSYTVVCSFEQTNYPVLEDPTTVEVCITCTDSSLTSDITINVVSSSGAATRKE